VSVLCQPEDADRLRGHGFTDVRPVEATAEVDGITLTRTPARHGSGATAELMAPVSGYLLRDDAGRTLYVAGDTVLYDAVEAVLDEHRPDVVVVNASGAHFSGGDPIVMDTEDVIAVARRLPTARVVAVHLGAINHCVQTRADLHQRLHEVGLEDRVTVPEDGAAVPVDQ
jgi:L-ascorbate metabolism protein UlaG (beta-lactamase superfamily)